MPKTLQSGKLEENFTKSTESQGFLRNIMKHINKLVPTRSTTKTQDRNFSLEETVKTGGMVFFKYQNYNLTEDVMNN